MDFDTAFRMYAPEIRRLSRRQFVPGMEAEDVASEMTICLWKASASFSGDTPFGVYWWSVWLNKKADLIAAANAKKRPPTLPTHHRDLLDSVVTPKRDPDPPRDCTPVEALVWRLLSAGETTVEVRSLTELTRRGYYALIERWRTDDVRSSLLD